jgi:prolyl-tRNA synthetase
MLRQPLSTGAEVRWSQAFIPTLRDDPADAEAASHRLLVRAGYIRQLMAGVYSLLPPAFRVRAKIRRIIEEEIDSIGGQQFLLPAIHPAELWQQSGRWEVIGDDMFRLKDRRGADLALGFTHEEVFATLASELTSYRQLPQIWYQIQTKFRDEPRPKSGLLRVREFTMKDSYSFDIDAAGLDASFDLHYGAYRRIFERFGVEAFAVEASSGAMGGSDSVEFMVRSTAGEDDVVHSPECGYAANVERAVSVVAPVEDPEPSEIEKFATPGIRTIDALAAFPEGAAPDRQIKTLVYMLDGEPALVMLRGDHQLQEQKLQDGTGSNELRPAHSEEIRALLGADAGSLGAVGVTVARIVADDALRGRRGMTTGANEDDFHVRNVDVARDVVVGDWLDLRTVVAGEPCIECGNPLEVFRAIEVGHIFKLGTRYGEAMNAAVLDEAGASRVIWMGSYGIGLERNLAAVVEARSDEKGIVWPVSIAPWEVVVTVLKTDAAEVMDAANTLYTALLAAGVDTIIDDRDERPGVKFNDAELVGIPYRVTVGPRGLASGAFELVTRSDGEVEEVPVGEAVDRLVSLIEADRR